MEKLKDNEAFSVKLNDSTRFIETDGKLVMFKNYKIIRLDGNPVDANVDETGKIISSSTLTSNEKRALGMLT